MDSADTDPIQKVLASQGGHLGKLNHFFVQTILRQKAQIESILQSSCSQWKNKALQGMFLLGLSDYVRDMLARDVPSSLDSSIRPTIRFCLSFSGMTSTPAKREALRRNELGSIRREQLCFRLCHTALSPTSLLTFSTWFRTTLSEIHTYEETWLLIVDAG